MTDKQLTSAKSQTATRDGDPMQYVSLVKTRIAQKCFVDKFITYLLILFICRIPRN